SWIDAFGDLRAEPPKYLSCFMHALERNVWIDVTAAKEHRRAVERTGIVARRAGRTDQPAAQPSHRRVAPRLARDELERKTGALGEAEERDPLVRDALGVEPVDDRADRVQRRRQLWFVLLQR